MSSSATARVAYHHGDLRNALIEAAAGLARTGGPDAVTIRAAARAVGVTPTAAYRHFSGHEQLLDATQEEAMVRMAEAMNTELRIRPREADPVVRALGNLAAVGRGYLSFALRQPGLFRTAFCPGKVLPPSDEQIDDSPYNKLVAALDDLVACGFLTPERRAGAEFTAWSLVHGMAMLFVDGALREADEAFRKEAVVQAMVTLVDGFGGGGLSGELRAAVEKAARWGDLPVGPDGAS